MDEPFDPYHIWLGIPPEELPANHYRLLSLRLFEPNGAAIDSAADRQTAHLRTFQGGKNSDLSQQLLNEVAAARVCLLDPKKRADYDRQLRARLVVRTPGAPAAQAGVPQAALGTLAAPILRRPAATTPAAPASASQPADQWDDLLGPGDAKQRPATATAQSRKAAAAKRAATSRMLAVGAAVGLAVLGVVGFAVYSQMNPRPAMLVFDWPGVERSDVSASVDGAAILVPTTGPWEHACPPGEHHIVAQRPGYKLSETVTAEAGQRQAVPANWRPKAALVLNWRPADRAGTTLIVDGQPHPISQQEPLELPVEPGSHVVRIAWPSAEPFQAKVEVAPDGRRTLLIPPPAVEAMLVLRWPADQRAGAQIRIDGESPVTEKTSAQVVQFALRAGRHTVRITRPGFQPFEQVVEVTATNNVPLVPAWMPELAETNPLTGRAEVAGGAPAATQSPEGDFGNLPSAKKRPIPSAEEQAKLARQLDELYKPNRSAKSAVTAQELYDLADKAQDTPAERYMLLQRGAELAAETGDGALAFHGIDLIAADYELEPFEAKQKLLGKAVAAATTAEQLTALVGSAEQLLDQAIGADRYDTAMAIAAAASKALGKRPLDAQLRKDTEDLLSRRRRDIHMLEPLWAAAQKAQKTLEQNAADSEANLTLGRWYCFCKNDWQRGLPLLAKGKDEKLKALAQTELKPPANANGQVQLADGWFDASPTEIAYVRDAIRVHAGDLYTAALPSLNSPLVNVKIGKRLAEIAKLERPGAPASVSTSSGSGKFPRGRWVDLLRLIDTKRDAVSGTWSRNGQEIDSPGRGSRVTVPVVVKGSYDLEIDFTRTSGNDCVGIMLPIGSGSCMVVLSGWGGGASGLACVNGVWPISPEGPIAVRPGNLENNHRYRLLVSARIVSEDHASVDVSLDGKPYFPNWSGDPATLLVLGFWRMPNPTEPGLAAAEAVTFHSARLRMVSGTASLDSALLSGSH